MLGDSFCKNGLKFLGRDPPAFRSSLDAIFDQLRADVIAIPLTCFGRMHRTHSVSIRIKQKSCKGTWVAGFMGLGGITGMLMVSGAYHTTNWHPEVRVWMRRVDHVMIFVCIAGIYTCYALLLLNSALSQQLIAAFWLITLLGGLLKLVWVMAPRLISVVLYVGMSWSCILIAAELQAQIGLNAILAILFTGIGISIGAVLYALAWPGPEAKVFGYHEIFHLTVVIHLAVHVWVIAEYALRVI